MKKLKFKCIKDPKEREDVVGKVMNVDDWKTTSVGWCNDASSLAMQRNLRALSGKDVIDYLTLVLKMEFEQVN